MMKYTIIAIILCFALTGKAQNIWEKPDFKTDTTVSEQEEKEQYKLKDAPKYLTGAVPLVNGKVEWSETIAVKDKTADELYSAMMKYLTDMTKQENQLPVSNVTLINKQEHSIVAVFQEWLVFKNTFLSLDRTKFNYVIQATCKDGSVSIRMFKMSYLYNNGDSQDTNYKAEEWITDSYAMNKKHTKLRPYTGKFRRKTIDRKDFIFNDIARYLNGIIEK